MNEIDRLRIFENITIQKGFSTDKSLKKILHENKIQSPEKLGDFLLAKNIIDSAQLFDLQIDFQNQINAINKTSDNLIETKPQNMGAQIICPFCKAYFLVNDSDLMKDVRCSKCKNIFQIGNPNSSAMFEINIDSKNEETVDKKQNIKNQETVEPLSRTLNVKDVQFVNQVNPSDDQQSLRNFLLKLDISPNAELPQSGIIEKSLTESSRYIYGQELARGGMGAIISTRDLDTKRNLVTKTLLKNSSKKALLRFIEEAQITAQLEHPNIVPVYDIGVNKSGNIFYTMKHVKGKNLQKLIDQYFMDSNDGDKKKQHQNHLIEILIAVCNAVAFAHSKKVIHRDLKPENIMIGEYGEVILMDFGLAKILTNKKTEVEELGAPITSSRNESDQMLTLQGDIAGTPKYMAPEQAKGDINEQDERTDIYALGAILFSCIANTPPTPGKSITEVLNNVMAGVRHSLPINVAPELVAIINHAMEVDKNKRYQTVKELSSDLQLFLKGFSISAKEDHWGVMALKLIKRNYPVFMTTVIALLIVLVLGSFAVFHILKEKEDAVANLNKYLAAQNIAEKEKIKNTNLQNEKIKQWKPFYEEKFENLNYKIMPEIKDINGKLIYDKDAYGFGNWVIPKGKIISQKFDFENGFNLIDKKLWLADGKLHFSAPNNGYLYLNKEVFGNIRMDTCIQYLNGPTPEITLFLYGSREKQENDGYSFAFSTKVKLQKKGLTIYEQEIPIAIQKNEKYNIRFERIGNTLLAYINDLNKPIFQWEDPEPIWGSKNSICGFYIWNGELGIEKFVVTKQAWAKQNSPLDFVERFRKKGYDNLAIEEYKEIIFASDDDIQKAEAFFEMGKTYKHAGLTQDAIDVFNAIVQNSATEISNISFSDKKLEYLIKKSYIFLFLIELDASYEQLDSSLNNWPPKLKLHFDNVVNHCKNDPSLEIIFTYMITKIIPKEPKQEEHRKGIRLLKILIEKMDKETSSICQKALTEFLCDISLKYMNPKDVVYADELLTEAINFNNKESKAYQFRGFTRIRFYEELNKLDEGAEDLRHAITIYPSNVFSYLNLANYFIKKKTPEKAIDILKEGLKNIPNSVPIMENLAMNYLDFNYIDEFTTTISEINKISPNNPKINYLMGYYYFKNKKNDLLETHLSNKEKILINVEDYNGLMGLLNFSQKKFNDAILFFSKIPKEKYRTEFNSGLAFSYYEIGEYEKAKDNLFKIEEIIPLNSEEKKLLILINEKLKK